VLRGATATLLHAGNVEDSPLLQPRRPNPLTGKTVTIPLGTSDAEASLLRAHAAQDIARGPPPPEPDPSLPPYGTSDKWRFDRTMRRLYKLQFPTRTCNNIRDVRDLLEEYAADNGREGNEFGHKGERVNYGHIMSLGSELIDYRAAAFAVAAGQGGTLVYPQPQMDWQSVAKRDCYPAWWSCWFNPSVGCEELGGLDEYQNRHKERRIVTNAHSSAVLRAHELGSEVDFVLQCQIEKDKIDRTDMHCVDREVEFADRGWWMMHVAMLMMQPNKVLLQHLERTKLEVGFEHPIVGVHMRGTDKHLEAERLGVETYTDLAVRMLKQNGWTRVYVATDDARWSREVVLRSLIKSARRLTYPHEITLVMRAIPRTNGATWDQALAVGITEFGRNTVTDTMLLSQCDGFIGTKSSLFSQVALLLGIGFHDRRMYAAADDDESFGYKWAPSTFGLEELQA